jgi:hypothetical protein
LTGRANVIVNVVIINKQAPRFADSICGGMLNVPENRIVNFNLNIYDEDRGDYGVIKTQIGNRINIYKKYFIIFFQRKW